MVKANRDRSSRLPTISGDRVPPSIIAALLNKAVRDRHILLPGSGRWVEYILPDKRSIFVESRTGRIFLGKVPGADIVARVHIQAGATNIANDLLSMVRMGYVLIEGDKRALVDVVRTAPHVGLYVADADMADLIHSIRHEEVYGGR